MVGGGGSGCGVRVDVNEEFKYWENSPKKFWGGGGVRRAGGQMGGVGLVGGSGWM